MTGEELKKELKFKGYTFSRFARDIGVTYKTVSCWINGRHPIPSTIPVILRKIEERRE